MPIPEEEANNFSRRGAGVTGGFRVGGYEWDPSNQEEDAKKLVFRGTRVALHHPAAIGVDKLRADDLTK